MNTKQLSPIVAEFGYTKTAGFLTELNEKNLINDKDTLSLRIELKRQYLFSIQEPSIKMLNYIMRGA